MKEPVLDEEGRMRKFFRVREVPDVELFWVDLFAVGKGNLDGAGELGLDGLKTELKVVEK